MLLYKFDIIINNKKKLTTHLYLYLISYLHH